MRPKTISMLTFFCIILLIFQGGYGQPNLRCTALTFTPTSVNPGGPIELSGTIENNGTVGIGTNIKINFYLSTSSSQIDYSKFFHFFNMPSPLAAGDTKNFNETNVVVPSTIPPDNYYVWISIDPDNAIPEINDGDNKSPSASQLSVAGSTYTLTVNVSPLGSGIVSKSPDKTNYINNEIVQLTAIPNAGYQFDQWSGDLSGGSNPATITMDGNKSVTAHFIPISNLPPIEPVVSPLQTVGAGFWVAITVGTSSKPVTDLKIGTFELQYTNTAIIDYLTHDIGPFITGAQVFIVPDDPNGKISASIYRTTGGDSGSGIVLRLKFKILNSATVGQLVDFSFIQVQANNSSNGEITLSLISSSIEIVDNILVWPGDANNDGQVSIFDINPIVATHWNLTGPVRPNASTQWIAQPCAPWNPVDATYADCDGSGQVDIFDINPVIVNFGNTHTLSKSLSFFKADKLYKSLDGLPITVEERDYDDITHDFWIDINVGTPSQPVTDLKIVSFELSYSNTDYVDHISHEIGPFLTGGQATVMVDDPNGKVSAAVYRTSGGNSGSGVILSLKFNAEMNHTVDFNFDGVMANNSTGGVISVSPSGKTVTTLVDGFSDERPNEFVLFPNYPNPFNQKTAIRYHLPQSSHVILGIYNLKGQEIVRLVNENKLAGIHEAVWDGRNSQSMLAPSGLYIYQIVAGDFKQSRKLILSQ